MSTDYIKLDPPLASGGPQDFSHEGKSLTVTSTTAGTAWDQDMTGFGTGWSNNFRKVWAFPGVGDELKLQLPVAVAGTYDISTDFTIASDFGIAQR